MAKHMVVLSNACLTPESIERDEFTTICRGETVCNENQFLSSRLHSIVTKSNSM